MFKLFSHSGLWLPQELDGVELHFGRHKVVNGIMAWNECGAIVGL